jgi:hypothetical protein
VGFKSPALSTQFSILHSPFSINLKSFSMFWSAVKRVTQVSIAATLPVSLIYTYGGYEPLSEIGVGTMKLQHQLLQDKGTLEDYVARLEAYQRRKPNRQITKQLPQELEEYLMDIISKGKDSSMPITSSSELDGNKSESKDTKTKAKNPIPVNPAKKSPAQAPSTPTTLDIEPATTDPQAKKSPSKDDPEARAKQREHAIRTYARLANLTPCCMAIANYTDKEIIGEMLQLATKYSPQEQLGALKIVEGMRRNRALNRGTIQELSNRRKTVLDVLKDYQTWWQQSGSLAEKLTRNPLAKYAGGWVEQK